MAVTPVGFGELHTVNHLSGAVEGQNRAVHLRDEQPPSNQRDPGPDRTHQNSEQKVLRITSLSQVRLKQVLGEFTTVAGL